jgi:membrane protein
VKNGWELIKRTYDEWSAANVSRLASSLAYFTVFSITPLLVIAIGIVGAIFGPEVGARHVSSQLRDLLGPAAAEIVETTLRSATQDHKSGVRATVVGLLLLAYGASGVFTALQESLNTIWGVAPKPNLGFWHTVRLRLLSFGMVVATGFLLVVSLLVSAVLGAANEYLSGGASSETVWRVLHLGVSIAVFGLMFAMIYRVLPDVRIPWEDVWIGGLLTAVLFSAGKVLIGLYLGRSGVASAYGAAGSLVLFLLWVYYSSQILFLGAAFTKVNADAHGHFAVPNGHAVPVTEEARAREGLARPETVEAAAAARPVDGPAHARP